MKLSAEHAPPVEVSTPAPRRTDARSRFARSLRRYWQLYLLLLLPVIWFIVFRYVPMANAVIAFKNYNPIDGVWGSPWVCLLYTSPSPRDKRQSRMPSSA